MEYNTDYNSEEENKNTPNGNEPEQTTNTTQKPANKQSQKLLIGLLVLILLGSWGYFLFSNKQNSKEKEDLSTTALTATSEKEDLQNQLNDASLRLDELRTSNAIADSVIQSKDNDIQDLKKRISSILSDKNATSSQLAEARRLISELKGNIANYTSEIDRLKEENSQLMEQNQQMTVQRDEAQKNYDSATNVITQKQEVIDVGSTLHASNFQVKGIKEKKSGKEKTTTKAKKVDKLNVSFSLDENRITESGSKELYVVILGPDGQPVSSGEMGSGRFVTRDGVNRAFTKRLNVDYQQGKKREVDFDWQQDKFTTGNYLVEVYNNGFKIGEGTVDLKKGGIF